MVYLIQQSKKIIGALSLGFFTLQASVVTLNYRTQQVTHVGLYHTTDPEHYQYQILTIAWENFFKTSAPTNRCVIIEHPTEPYYKPKSYTDGITTYGDWGAALYYAQQNNIPVIAGDPLRYEAFKKLDQNNSYKKDHILCAYFIMLLEIYSRDVEKTDAVINIETVTTEFAKVFPGVSLEHLTHLYKKITHRTCDYRDHDFYSYVMSWPPRKSIVGFFCYQFNALLEIRALINDVHIQRDIATVAIIKRELEAGKDVFVVYGKAHQAFHIQGMQKIVAEIN